ncbi:hypothetical protein CWI38_1156p0030 [Hamiltosporidium tvaerminnensis]|uniref:Uncharacterized protein n=1 Tax=Hamiltosporidium tvaerminnensis TaxID=1176355 RepID=A0A4Q9LVA6_9MICR|nr:hypothetical protein CWI38_1156p0030 [Hamiltosporidium tvaerminnensis]
MRIAILFILSNILCSFYSKKKNLIKKGLENMCCTCRKPKSQDIDDFKLTAEDLHLSEERKIEKKNTVDDLHELDTDCYVIYNKGASTCTIESKKDIIYEDSEVDYLKGMDALPIFSNKLRKINDKSNSLQSVLKRNSKYMAVDDHKESSDTEEDEVREKF